MVEARTSCSPTTSRLCPSAIHLSLTQASKQVDPRTISLQLKVAYSFMAVGMTRTSPGTNAGVGLRNTAATALVSATEAGTLTGGMAALGPDHLGETQPLLGGLLPEEKSYR